MPGLVQEPALTLVEQAPAAVLVNAMHSADAEQYLGGTYEFMGVAVRTAEIAQRRAGNDGDSRGRCRPRSLRVQRVDAGRSGGGACRAK